MNKYLIFADGSADLDLNFAKENDIKFIPMQYTLGEDEALASGTNTDEEMTIEVTEKINSNLFFSFLKLSN